MSPAKKSVSIPVKVERTKRSPKPRTVLPTATAPQQPPVARVAPQLPTLKKNVHALPEQHRKRLMWGIVAIGMFVIVLGWAMTLGNVLKQDNREVSLLQQISGLFQGFNVNAQPKDNQTEEIRELNDQVFPQF